ncbi:hypothetical protein L209DRAFT_164076 [Thermothelomyces heterothallicus CBS 203.75]
MPHARRRNSGRFLFSARAEGPLLIASSRTSFESAYISYLHGETAGRQLLLERLPMTSRVNFEPIARLPEKPHHFLSRQVWKESHLTGPWCRTTIETFWKAAERVSLSCTPYITRHNFRLVQHCIYDHTYAVCHPYIHTSVHTHIHTGTLASHGSAQK